MADDPGQDQGDPESLRAFAPEGFARQRLKALAQMLDVEILSFSSVDDDKRQRGGNALGTWMRRHFKLKEKFRRRLQGPPEIGRAGHEQAHPAGDAAIFDLYHWRCASELCAGEIESERVLSSRRTILFLDEADMRDASLLELRRVERAVLCADLVIGNGNLAKILPNWVIGAVDVVVNLPAGRSECSTLAAGSQEVAAESVAWERRQWYIAIGECFRDPTGGQLGAARIGWLFVAPEHYIVHLIRSARHGMQQSPVNGFQKGGPIWGLLKAVIRKRVDVVIVHGWGTVNALGMMLLARCRGIPYIVMSDTFRRTNERNVWYAFGTSFLRSKAIIGAACLMPAGVPQAEYMRTALRAGTQMPSVVLAQFGVDVPRLAAQVAAVPKELCEETRRTWGVEPDQMVALYLGKLVGVKGADRLPAIAQRVGEAGGSVDFVVLGSGPMKSQLENAVREGAQLRLLGAKYGRDVVVALAAADVLIVPSREEQWGLVVNEAMAAGIPVIVTDGVGSASDLVRSGGAGIVCDNDVDSISDAVRRLADDAELREEFGKRGKEHVQEWSVQAMVRAVVVGCHIALEK